VAGIALSTALVTFVNVALLIGALRRRVGGLGGRRAVATAARVIAAAGIALAAAVIALRLAPADAATTLARVVRLTAALGTFLVCYLAACVALRVEELGLLRDLVRRR
jgi:peptidoglycan biosynthesis protein MviN/MurJ (putative lipid II flippase)